MKKIVVILFAIVLILVGCRRTDNSSGPESASLYSPRHATGFSIDADSSGGALISVRSPWATEPFTLLVLPEGAEAPEGYSGQSVHGPVERIAVMSSTHIALLGTVGARDRIVAVSGLPYITDSVIASRPVADIGYDAAVDYELLMSLRPDIVLLYGIDGASPMESKLRQLRIPFLYVGDFMEPKALGKAEWIVPLAELVGRRKEGIHYFDSIAARYDSIAATVDTSAARPKVMLNAPYSGSWFMPPRESYVVNLITDAGAQVINCVDAATSRPVDLEEAFLMISDADYWLNPGMVSSQEEVVSAHPRFADTLPVRDHRIYNNNRQATATGGNPYFESGVVQPDVVLTDLISIFHPSSSADTTCVYFQHL